MKNVTCYMCDAPATSGEHVPPKCIFPIAPEFRKNLVKVPSCDAHNLGKTKDDELLRHVLASAPGNNELALQVVEQGVIPAWEHRPHILATFLPNFTPLEIGDLETASFTINLSRFESSIEAIVRGLFFADTGNKLLLNLDIVWGAFMTKDHSSAPFFEIVRRGEQRFPPMRRGSNPRVFRYDFHHEGAAGICRLRFYEGHPIYAVWENEPNQQPQRNGLDLT